MKTLLIHYGPGNPSLTKEVVEQIRPMINAKHELVELDLTNTKPDIFDADSMTAYVKRNYRGEEITEAELKLLLKMDTMADQLLEADFLVMVFPMYNFNVPAAIKAWIDSVSQAKKLFKYGEYGPEGLSSVSKAFVVNITGGTPQNSAKDFVTPYMKVFLNFIGINEIAFSGLYGSKFIDTESKNIKIENISLELDNFLSN